MMQRRDFMKRLGLLGACYGFGMAPRLKLRADEILITESMIKDQIDYSKPAVLPKVINIFLYGGPSELAGNLSNIQTINQYSQNPYPNAMLPDVDGSDVTANFFWRSAGGELMETMLASGDMSIYRTIYRIKDDHKGHGKSVTQNLTGSLSTENPGIATTLSSILSVYNPFGKDINDMVLPVVSFEGESVIFRKESLIIPDVMKPIALDYRLDNPYSRSYSTYIQKDSDSDSRLEQLARTVSGQNAAYEQVNGAFLKRSEIASFIESKFSPDILDANLPIDPDTGVAIVYPDTTFGRQMKAAMSLAIENEDTYFISVGGGGLGGWDDHSDALAEYPVRMNNLMSAVDVAVRHANLKAADNIVINVFGDFGRNVNLNNSGGWDHGNNQNLYTFGGGGIAGRTLGRIVGETEWSGTANENRQFTVPKEGSYSAEPFSIASTIYRYFGVENPEILTGEPVLE